MLDALLRCSGVALVLVVTGAGVVRAGPVPMRTEELVGEEWAEETAAPKLSQADAATPPPARLAAAIPPGSSSAPASPIVIPLPSPLWSGAVGLAGIGAALAMRKGTRDA